MKMADPKKPLEDFELEDMFAAARSSHMEPTPDLMARIMADAEEVAAGNVQAPQPDPSSNLRSTGFLGQLLAAIGGWPAMAGLATAGVTGLVIGLGSAETLDGLASDYLNVTAEIGLDGLVPSYTGLLDEG